MTPKSPEKHIKHKRVIGTFESDFTGRFIYLPLPGSLLIGETWHQIALVSVETDMKRPIMLLIKNQQHLSFSLSLPQYNPNKMM